MLGLNFGGFMKTYEGNLESKGLKIAIVVSRFNELITTRLFDGAVDRFVRLGGTKDDLTVVRVPGAFEIPVVAKKMAESKKYDGIVCLGAIIKGSTSHDQYIASEVAKGIAQSSMDSSIPISFGIITSDNLEQAIERAGTKMGNKGVDAMSAVIETANVMKQL